MTALLIIAVIVFLVIGVFLFTPFTVEINTETPFYGMRCLFGMVTLQITIAGFVPQFTIDFLGHRYQLRAQQKEKKVKRERETNSKKRKSISWKWVFRKAKLVCSSFKVKECFATLDTGATDLNGLLYPIAFLASKSKKVAININFEHRNKVRFRATNSFARIAYCFIIK